MAVQVKPEDRVPLLKHLVKQGIIKLKFIDCETAPMEVYTHYIGNKVSIYHEQIKTEQQVITIQYMDELDKEPFYLQWDESKDKDGNIVHDDRDMINTFTTEIVNEPDVVIVGQNHKDFDFRVLNFRIAAQELIPMHHDMIKVDTLKQAKSAMRFPSYKLDYRSKLYGLGGKIKMEFQDWVDIMKGDKKKLAKMIKYGCKDITDLRSLFWRELPYYDKLPAALEKLLAAAQACCPECERKKKGKYNIEKVGTKYVCLNCGEKFKST